MSYTILLVEDDQDLSAITKANLVHAGHHVETAFTCAQAEEALAKNSYDILLLDVMLPDGRGDQICRRMQPGGSCPVIFLSCLEDSDTVVGALRGGRRTGSPASCAPSGASSWTSPITGSSGMGRGRTFPPLSSTCSGT